MSLTETAQEQTDREQTAQEQAPAEAVVSTAAARPAGRLRRLLGWVFVVVLLVGISLTSMRFVATAPSLEGTLNPEVSHAYGARALAELLRDQGVEIEVVRSHEEALTLLRDDSTLVTTDPYPLSDASVVDLIEASGRAVFLSSSSRLLRLSGLGEPSSESATSVSTDCAIPAFARVGEISPGRLFTPSDEAFGCFATPDGSAAVLILDDAQQSITIVDGTRLFDNEHLAEQGNAALGLALLGQGGHIVWYVPSFADGDNTGAQEDTLGTLTPDWVTPVLVLLALAAVTAMIWRGRRFGPLVAESLPVTVRASETMHGRARLTARAGDAAHAAAEIRTGTVMRLSRRLALSGRATAQEVADAASDRLHVPRGSLYELLAGPAPHNDPDLIALARGLADLEAAVEAAVRTERNDQ